VRYGLLWRNRATSDPSVTSRTVGMPRYIDILIEAIAEAEPAIEPSTERGNGIESDRCLEATFNGAKVLILGHWSNVSAGPSTAI
jgi:hypothetical protein